MSRVRVVIDANVLVSRLLLPQSVPAQAVRKLLQFAQPLASEVTLQELAQTLSRPKFDPYVSRKDRELFFALYARLAEWVTITTSVRVCRDLKDNRYLELAVDGQARVIISGDKDLLAVSPYKEIRVLTPAAVLAMPDGEWEALASG
jgi:putative PIN family toxin of toxin-antitoxin system